MTRPDTVEMWEQVRVLVVRYSLLKYGCLPTSLTLGLPEGVGAHVEPIRGLSAEELAQGLDPKPTSPLPWPEIAHQLRLYAEARFAQKPFGVTFEFARGGCATVPLPEANP